MLKVTDLTKEYTHCGTSFLAVDHANFKLEDGTFAVLMGQSGSGKSTLFHMLSGLTMPSNGHVLFNDQEITSMSQKNLAQIRSTDIGYILQGQNLLHNFTISENICMPNYFGKMLPDTQSYMQELLTEFQLAGMENEMPSTLSGGEQRRVAIARALIHKPKLIIADEPTSNLDSLNAELILKYLRKATKNGTTVLISTHDKDTSCFGDVVWHMEKGKLTL